MKLMKRWSGLGLVLVVVLGLEVRATTTSLTVGLVGKEASTGQLKAEYYQLDGTYVGKVYLKDGGNIETYGFGGAEIYGGGAGKIAVTDSGSSFISTYGLTGVKEGSVALTGAESTSYGLALGANATGTPEWAVSRQHWSGSGWALAYDLTGNNTFSQLPCNEPSPCEISSADVTAAHPGNEVLWASHYWQGGVALYIRDSRLGTYGEFNEYFHRYDTVYGDLNGGGVVNTIYGDLVADHAGNEFGIISKDGDGEFWVNYYSADLGDYSQWGIYGGPSLDQVQLGTSSLDFTGGVGSGIVPEPATVGMMVLGGLGLLRKRKASYPGRSA